MRSGTGINTLPTNEDLSPRWNDLSAATNCRWHVMECLSVFGKVCPVSHKAQVCLSPTKIFAFQAVANRPCSPANELAGYNDEAH